MNLPVEKVLPDNMFWKYFLLICSIPHPSGHEERLRDVLIAEAEKHGLTCRVDKAGNLAIDRAAAANCEDLPVIIMQAHLDMVPQAADGVEFDFLRDSVQPVVADGWISTGNRTTLGADDGTGVALAMELLTDKTLQCGALRGVFTVCEETGLGGAEDIAPEFLAADYLINLDSDQPFVVGCAGGARFDGSRQFASQQPLADNVPLKITLNGMHGGHSGEDIHKNVGSAVKVMGQFLQEISAKGFMLASVDAGTLHNAIARSAGVFGTLPECAVPAVQTLAGKYSEQLNSELIPAAGEKIRLTVEVAGAVPPHVLTSEAQNTLLAVWNALPHGLLKTTAAGDSQTSCNLAVLQGKAGEKWSFTLLARSIYNEERDEVVKLGMDLLTEHGFAAKITGAYSSWSPRWESPFLEYACQTCEKISGKAAQKTVIHGGLEPGMFCQINPRLDMISFAPRTLALHSPQERMEISSAEEMRELLRALVENIRKVKRS